MASKKIDKKSATLFDHIKQVRTIQAPNYWEELSDTDKRTWSNFMILRYISMDADWLEVIAELQPYLQQLPPNILYKVLIGIITPFKAYIPYISDKKSNEAKYEKWLIQLLVRDLECSEYQSKDFLDILYASKEGHLAIELLCTKYGVDPKEIKKLKLKL